ncbi:hypothetical protein BD560DRAFT_429756 [Blakeslea trispora]|nr:hypothetical protein BD560DRAFT_429756 [Blakeslea trispora]
MTSQFKLLSIKEIRLLQNLKQRKYHCQKNLKSEISLSSEMIKEICVLYLNTENVCLSFRIIGLFDIGCTRFPYATFPWVVKRLHIALTFAPIIWTSIRSSFISDNNSNRRSHSFVEIFKPSQIST